MRPVLTIASAELIRRVRSRSAIINVFVAPLALAMVFGLALDNSSDVSFTIGVVDSGGTATSAGIVDGLVSGDPDEQAEDGEGGSVSFVRLPSPERARQQVDDGDFGAVIDVTSSGFIVVTNPGQTLAASVAQSVAGSVATAVVTGTQQPTPMLDLPLGGGELSASAFFGASMAILLLFFATGSAAQSILEERDNRVLDRILAGPTTSRQVLVGKVLALSLLAVGGFVTVWVVTSLAFGANWGNPLAVFVLIVFTVFALGGVATFVGGFATTPQQATTITAIVVFGLSLLGGNFTGPADAPAALRAVRRYTPNGRALELFTELSVDSAPLRTIASGLLVLFLFGLVFGAIGLARLNRTVTNR